MRAGIIGAMEQEVTFLRSIIANQQTHVLAGCEIYTGTLNGAAVALLRSGIGKVSAAIGTTLLHNLFQPDIIINTGSAGGLASTLRPGDIVISEEVRYHDVDVTAFGYETGQMAGCPAAFLADDRLVKTAEKCSAHLRENAVRGLIVSGDTFINGAEPLKRIRQHFPDAIAVEMEAASVAQVCHQFSTPFVILRAISDVADQQSHHTFEEFLDVAAKKSSRMVETLLNQLMS